MSGPVGGESILDAEAPFWDRWMTAALRAGVSVSEFWAQTPHETELAIQAAGWRDARARRHAQATAWQTAVLVRTRVVPSLRRFLGLDRARALRGRELNERRRQHDDIVRRLGKIK